MCIYLCVYKYACVCGGCFNVYIYGIMRKYNIWLQAINKVAFIACNRKHLGYLLIRLNLLIRLYLLIRLPTNKAIPTIHYSMIQVTVDQ